MQTGIIGLPQVGKTTLFRILTKAHVDAKGAQTTHVGVAKVPEPRLRGALNSATILAGCDLPRKSVICRISGGDTLGGFPYGQRQAKGYVGSTAGMRRHHATATKFRQPAPEVL